MAKGYFKWESETTSPTYNSWRSMRNRCLFNNTSAKHYKDKGITICAEWIEDFDSFVRDMGMRPSDTTLDRKDPLGNYEPSNCRWASHREQQNNKHSLTSIEKDGIFHTIGEWAYILDLTQTELSKAYKRYSAYGASSFDEIFYTGSLLSKRVSERDSICKICSTTSTAKWRKDGMLCNTCYHRALRWSKRENKNIEEFPEWNEVF